MTETEPTILDPADTCWKVARADRAAVLVDAAAYYAALRKSLLAAQRSIYIVGWDIDSRVKLVGDPPAADDGAPEALGDLLTHLVEQRPDLEIHVLLWDYSVVYALEREPLPTLNLQWATPPQIKVCLDDVLPLAASHHQKIVVIDDSVAFSGGIDLTIRRWDTSRHEPASTDRRTPNGEPYDPFHDVQMVVDGAAAAALAELVRERWEEAACEEPKRLAPTGSPWPDGVDPDFADVDIGVARTLAPLYNRPEAREIERLYIRSIERAQRSIYIENQYVTADAIAESLARRMADNADLEVVIVSPMTHGGWLESQSMRVGRVRFMQRLEAAGVTDRVRLVFPAVRDDDGIDHGIFVHAKVMIVDDALLHVGSSNLNNRSMGMDSECDLAIEATVDAQRKAIRAVRARLLGEHLGLAADRVEARLDEAGSLIALVDDQPDDGRALRPIDDSDESINHVSQTVSALADPERPIPAGQYVSDMFGGAPGHKPVGRLAKLGVAGAVLVALVLAWKFTPLSALADPEVLKGWFERLDAGPWSLVLMPAAYILGSLISFPITVLIVMTAMVFGPWSGLAYALVGSLLGASATYLLGELLGRRFLRNALGTRLNKINRALARQGVLSVAAVRMAPVAPFTVINVVAGASQIKYREFLIGTLIGMGPGIVLISFLGAQLKQVLLDPEPQQIALFAAFAVGWIGLTLGLQWGFNKVKARLDD